MKKIVLFAVWLITECVALHAQSNLNFEQIGDVASIIRIDAKQEEMVRKENDHYLSQKRILERQKISSDVISKMYSLNRAHHQKLIGLLSEQQINEYCYALYTPEVLEQVEYYMLSYHGLEKNKPTSNENIVKTQLFEYFMKEKVVYFKYKYNLDLQVKEIESLKREQPEVLRFIKGKSKKERMAANKRVDVFRQYEIDKKNHEKLIKTMSDKQIADYCMLNFAPEVEAKTEYRLSLLTEVDNDYSESELEKIRNDIFNYLMLEKIVYYKYKYDYSAQKENIGRLKAIQPAAMKNSINNEKQKSYGKVVSGTVNWNHRRK